MGVVADVPEFTQPLMLRPSLWVPPPKDRGQEFRRFPGMRGESEAHIAEQLLQNGTANPMQVNSFHRSDAEHPSPALSARIRLRKGQGLPLSEQLQQEFSQYFNHDLSALRIHTDAESRELNRQLQATAFTSGGDIFLSMDPSVQNHSQSSNILVHEITHAIQQTQRSAGIESRFGECFVQRIPAAAGEIAVQIPTSDVVGMYRQGIDLVRSSHQSNGAVWLNAGDQSGGLEGDYGDTTVRRDSRLGPCIGFETHVEPGIYRAIENAGAGYSIEQLYQRMGGDLVWRDSEYLFEHNGVFTARYYFKPSGLPAATVLSEVEAQTPARDRVPEWAWQQWQAARSLLEEERISVDDEQEMQRLPESLVIIPGPSVQVYASDGGRIAQALSLRSAENGRILLQRAINLVANYTPPPERESIEGLTDSAPDWARRNVQWVRARIEQDRERYQQLAQVEAGHLQDTDATLADVERETAERRQLLEASVGLPSSMTIRRRRGTDQYVLALTQGERTAHLTLQEDEDPLRLYTRVLDAGRRLSTMGDEGHQESDLLRGHQEPWPVIIENIGTDTAVSGHAHWFTLHVSPPLSLSILPTLGANWHIFPVEENPDSATLGASEQAETGEVAADELSASLSERPAAVVEDADGSAILGAVLVATEALGAVGDVISYGMDYLSELGSGERGIVFPAPGRYIVHVTVFPRLSRSDASHFHITQEDLPAPAVAVFPIRVESARQRATAISEEGTTAEVEGAVSTLVAEIAELSERLVTVSSADERADIEGQIEVAERRLRSLQFQSNAFGFLSRRHTSVQQQIDDLRPLINYLDTRTERQPIDRASMPETVLALWEAMESQWRAQRIEGRRLSTFEVWVRQVVRDLERADAAAIRQRHALVENDFETAQRLPGAFVAQDGRQLPLLLAVRETYDEADDRTVVSLLDVSEVGAPDSGSRARQFFGAATGQTPGAKRAAFESLLQNYRENCGYGRGTLYLARPLFWSNEPGLPAQWVFDRHAGPSERWQERLENIATAAMLAGLVLSGPIGIAVGLVGATASAGVAVIRLERRFAQGTLRVDSEAFSAVIDVLSAPIAGLTAVSALRRAGRIVITSDRLRRMAEMGETAERIVGAVQVGHQLILLPRQLDTDMASLQHLSAHERRRHLLDLWVGYAQQFHGLTQTLSSVIGPEHHVDSSDHAESTTTTTDAGTSEVDATALDITVADATESVISTDTAETETAAESAGEIPSAIVATETAPAVEAGAIDSTDADTLSAPQADVDSVPESATPATVTPVSPNLEATGAEVTRQLYASDGSFGDAILEAAYQDYRQSRSEPLGRERWLNHVGGSRRLSARLEALLGPDWRARRAGRIEHLATAGPTTTWDIPEGRRRRRMEEIAMWREAFRHLRDAYGPSGDPRGSAMLGEERSAALARLEALMDGYEARTLSREEWGEFDRLTRRLRRDRFLRPTLSGISHGTEQVGALAGDLFIRETTGANRLYPTHITEAGTSGTVDGLYLQRESASSATRDLDIYHVAEFKGNTARLGGRVIDGEFYGQGHPRYLLETLSDMHRRGDIDARTFRRVLEAWREGRLRYVEVRTPIPEGSHPTIERIEARQFDIPAPADIDSRIAALPQI